LLKRLAFVITTVAILGMLTLALMEIVLRLWGFGDPPLYKYDSAVGYVLKPNQDLVRNRACRVHINNLGMRSPNTTSEKPADVYRVLVLGDSVPFGGSFIDQDDTFCYVAERLLNGANNNKRYQILNASVNALGPQNIQKLLETRGTYSADLVIVYFPWGDLTRGFTNFYIVPFWSNNPDWATAEFVRHVVWSYFGKFSRRWKEVTHFESHYFLKPNLEALKAMKAFCDERRVPVFFLWSPSPDVLTGRTPDLLAYEKTRLWRTLPPDALVDLGPQFNKIADVHSLFVDSCHYSKIGHHFAGEILRDFIKARKEARDTGTRDLQSQSEKYVRPANLNLSKSGSDIGKKATH
jgi:hypothetical protein